MQPDLDLAPLEGSLDALERIYQSAASERVRSDAALNELGQMAAIQAFEIAYDTSHKILRRFMEMTEADPSAAAQMSKQNLIRTASQRGLLLNDLSAWEKYNERRNETSHNYDEGIAQRVFETVPEFLSELRYLHDKLKERAADL